MSKIPSIKARGFFIFAAHSKETYMASIRILIVCLGNICRSPMAEGILKEKAKSKGLDVFIDSAGTSSEHSREHPDPRAIKTAKKFGVDISRLRARQFSQKDFDSFDRIFVMDSSNYSDVVSLARDKKDIDKVELFLESAGNTRIIDVPDPWFGGMEGFDDVFTMLNDASEKLADSILKELASEKK